MMGHPRTYCQCGKVSIKSEREARKVARHMKRWDRRDGEVHAYRCTYTTDEVWHIGHRRPLKPRNRR